MDGTNGSAAVGQRCGGAATGARSQFLRIDPLNLGKGLKVTRTHTYDVVLSMLQSIEHVGDLTTYGLLVASHYVPVISYGDLETATSRRLSISHITAKRTITVPKQKRRTLFGAIRLLWNHCSCDAPSATSTQRRAQSTQVVNA